MSVTAKRCYEAALESTANDLRDDVERHQRIINEALDLIDSTEREINDLQEQRDEALGTVAQNVQYRDAYDKAEHEIRKLLETES